MTTPSIRLDQFLKLTGLVGTGGQAKVAIQAGEILVNGDVETRRRRQLQPGDVIVWGDDEFEVEAASDDETETEEDVAPASESETTSNTEAGSNPEPDVNSDSEPGLQSE